MRLRVLVGVSALLAAVSACGSPTPCAGVGVVSGVGVMFLHEGYDGLAGASYELCTRGKCAKGELEEEEITKVNLPLPDDVDPDASQLRFRVTRKGTDSPLIDATTDVKLSRQSDGCGGGAYNRGLAFTKDGGLTTKVPASVSAAWVKHVRELATASPSTAATAESR
ncbi:hypothetical protein [Streptomyces sp. MBT65]|uniref:hypothetical protein n=1 Tax=Streptomyces sp. MBT65 TaxID=1488395 RepID=UPI001F1D76B5|nr:hypothetical protein [Streptomyces sp. MBT65]